MGEARQHKQDARRRARRGNQLEVRQARNVLFGNRGDGGIQPVLAGLIQHDRGNLAARKRDTDKAQEPQFAEGAGQEIPRELAPLFLQPKARIEHPEQAGSLEGGHRLLEHAQQANAMAAVAAETFLEPPGKQVLVQAETILADKFKRLFRRNQARILLFQPAIPREEIKDQRKLVFGSLVADLLRHDKGIRANLVAAAMKHTAVVQLEVAEHCIRKYDTDMPIHQILVGKAIPRNTLQRSHGQIKATGKIRKTVIDRRVSDGGAPQQIFAAHRKQERLQVAGLAHGNRKAQFIVGESPGRTVVNEFHAAVLPRFHLFAQRRHAVLVVIKRKRLVLNQSVVQQALMTKGLRMSVAKKWLGHSVKESIQVKHQFHPLLGWPNIEKNSGVASAARLSLRR